MEHDNRICYVVGAMSLTPALRPYPNPGDFVIAADRGFDSLMAYGVTPDLAVGDFDSLGHLPDHRNVIALPVEKDDTDMAFALGNTLITSAYQVANNMPNVIYDLVAGGILGTAFLPVYLLERERNGDASSDAFASNILNISLVVLGAISLLATLYAPAVISTQTFTISDDAEVFNYAVVFFRIFAKCRK